LCFKVADLIAKKEMIQLHLFKDFDGLRKIRVAGEKREKFAISFGIMAANAVKIAKRRAEKERQPEQKAA